MHLLLDLGLIVSIKLVEVLWELCQVILLFHVNYGTEDLPTYITKPYLCKEDGHKDA